jgi:tetratricopeptide (TPR) repeat protein
LLKEKRFLATLDSLSNPSFFDLYSKIYLNFLKEGKLEPKEMVKLEKIANKREKKSVKILRYLEKAMQVNKANQKALYASLEKLTKEVSPELGASLFNYTAVHNVKVYPVMSAKRVYSKIFADSSYYSQYFISRDAILADSFEAYVEEKNRNWFEQKLFRKSMKILEKNGVARTLAMLYIKDGNFKKAQKYLDQVPDLNWQTEFNPFNVSLSGNNRKRKGKGYDQRKFVKTMLKLEESIKKNPTSAMDYFLHATGRYNSSWFGNFPESASVSRTLRGFDEEEANHILHNYDAIEKEYVLALKYAKKEEFKAKIAYQILKIKLNKEILVPSHASWWIRFGVKGWGEQKGLREQVAESKVLDDAYGAYVEKYKSTKYGKEIIGACATFGYFR